MAIVSAIRPKKQADAGTVHWLKGCIDRSKLGIVCETATVTPGLAAEILKRNPDNRSISPTKAQHYATDMINGTWATNGEPIIISEDGLLNDGQHRMQAIIDANVSLPMLFVFGVSRESRTTIDQGRARGAKDYLAMDGVPYSTNASTSARFIIAYERSAGQNLSARPQVTNTEVYRRVKSDPAIIVAAQYAHKNYAEYRHLFSITVMAACYYILNDIAADDAVEYLDQVALGESIKRGDPAFAVRTAFLNDKRERAEAMEIIFHGWNKFRLGEMSKIIRVNGRFPALV